MTTVLPQTGTSVADGDPELVKLVWRVESCFTV